MTIQILKDISGIVDYACEFEYCAYAAMLTGFYLVLRCSNLTLSSTDKFNTKEQLTRWHVSLDDELEIVIFLIEWSKNNQN